jgi:hypothetical protein
MDALAVHSSIEGLDIVPDGIINIQKTNKTLFSVKL